MGRLTRHEIEKTASELMYYKDKLANGIFGDKIGCFDKAMEALKELKIYKDLEESGRLYIMSEKLASHVKDVIAKAEYQARIKAETKHGMWMQDLDDIVCSECKTYWNVFDDCTETFKYCPNCGAKMEVQNG